jgi:hypothetical protein
MTEGKTMSFDGVVGFISRDSIRGWVTVTPKHESLPVHLRIKGKIVASMVADIVRTDFSGPGQFPNRGFNFTNFLADPAEELTVEDIEVLVEIDGERHVVRIYDGANVQIPRTRTPPVEALDRRKAKKISRKPK